jgi:hypothetical protein
VAGALPAGAVAVRAGGSEGLSPDGFARVTLTTLDLSPASTKPAGLRDLVVAKLLGVSAGSVSGLPPAFGTAATAHVLRFTTVLRGDGRVLYIGAVTERKTDDAPAKETRLVALDLANGTALARAGKGTQDECEAMRLGDALPMVDIIWVIDESGSMNDNRQDIASNANQLFSYAVQSGLDFRVGVTNVCNASGSYRKAVGKFCSAASTDPNDMGGVDRFLAPAEQATFAACAFNPPGYEGGSEYPLINAAEAVLRHLPRAPNDPARIRTGAQLIVIIATDEVPNELYGALPGSSYGQCTLDAAVQAKVDSAIQPYLDLFKGNIHPEAAASLFVIGGTCKNACNAEIAHGYKELVPKLGGQLFDICQKNLQGSLTLIFDDIIAAASPVKLSATPISASLKVTVDGVVVPRSQSAGFKYNAAANAIWFAGAVKIEKGSVVVVSYKRWQ